MSCEHQLLVQWWTTERPYCLHSAAWWRQHWERTGILDIAVADNLSEGWRFWLNWMKTIAPENLAEIRALEADAGDFLGYVRVVGRRRAEAHLVDLVPPVPVVYTRKPLLLETEGGMPR